MSELAEIKKAYGLRIKQRRLEMGLTQEELEEKSGVGQSTISRWERGREMASGENLVKVADALERTPDELLGRSPGFETQAEQLLKIAQMALESREMERRMEEAAPGILAVFAQLGGKPVREFDAEDQRRVLQMLEAVLSQQLRLP